MKTINYVFSAMLILVTGVLLSFSKSNESYENIGKKKPAVLIFSKTGGYRHEAIEKGVKTIEELGAANGFDVVHTEDSTFFKPGNLKKFKAIIFLSTTGDILNDAQQEAFQQYIHHGGGFVGVHAAADTEYGWPWYNKLVGAWFLSHPAQQTAKVLVVDKSHISTRHLPDEWVRKDEWYNYKDINPELHILMKLDESSYKGGQNGDNHPIAWYHDFEGGRAFYTGLGHTLESYDDEAFKLHLLGGIKYAMGE